MQYPKACKFPSYSLTHQMRLDLEPLNLILKGANLAHKVRGLIGGDGAGNNGTGDTASTAKSHLRRTGVGQYTARIGRQSRNLHVDVRNVLVLAKKRQVKEDSQRAGIGGKDNDFGNTTVESLGSLVGTLLQLAVVGGLLDKIENFLAESLVGLGPCGAGVCHRVYGM